MPRIHAGHQTHQTTIDVYMPQTLNPKLASFNTSAIEMLNACAEEYTTVGGAMQVKMLARKHLVNMFLLVCTNVNGVARMPTINASEKLSVASVARDIPRTSNENDLISWNCCTVALYRERM